MLKWNRILSALFIAVLPLPLMADEGSALNSADTAWILTSTGLVLFMTVPGLALFYGGLVRTKNVLSVLVQCFAVSSLVSVLWMVAGYPGFDMGDRFLIEFCRFPV